MYKVIDSYTSQVVFYGTKEQCETFASNNPTQYYVVYNI